MAEREGQSHNEPVETRKVAGASKALEIFTDQVVKAAGSLQDFDRAVRETTHDINGLKWAVRLLTVGIKEQKITSREDLRRLVSTLAEQVADLNSEHELKRGSVQLKLDGLRENLEKNKEEIKRVEEEWRQRDRDYGIAKEEFEAEQHRLAEADVSFLSHDRSPLETRMGGTRGERIFTTEGNLEEDRNWFRERIERLEAQDLTFSENWQDTYALKAYIASIPKEKAVLVKEFQEEYEDRRRFHDFMWIYRKAGEIGDLLNACNFCKMGVLERMKGRKVAGEYATKYMEWYGKMAERVYEVRDKVAKRQVSEEEGRKTEAVLTDEMKLRLDGKSFLQFDDEGNLVTDISGGFEPPEIRDLEDAAGYRIGGKLFSAFGQAAQYDIVLNGVQDFMLGRLLNMDKWASRAGGHPALATLSKYWNQEAFTGALFSDQGMNPQVSKDDLEHLVEKAGIKEKDGEGERGKKGKRIQYIADYEAFRKVRFSDYHVDEGTYGANYIDQFLKADKARSYLLSGIGYFKRPSMEAFMKMSEYLEHLKPHGKRERFTEGLLKGLIEFYDARQLPSLERWVVQKGQRGDRDRGIEERKEVAVWRVVHCDAERYYNAPVGWKSETIRQNIDRAVPSMISAEKAEMLKRKYLSFLGIGTRGARDLREFIEIVSPRIPGAILAALWEGLNSSLPEEVQVKEKRKR